MGGTLRRLRIEHDSSRGQPQSRISPAAPPSHDGHREGAASGRAPRREHPLAGRRLVSETTPCPTSRYTRNPLQKIAETGGIRWRSLLDVEDNHWRYQRIEQRAAPVRKAARK